jgi:hypothetical protein
MFLCRNRFDPIVLISSALKNRFKVADSIRGYKTLVLTCMASNDEGDSRKLRILCLHGYLQNAEASTTHPVSKSWLINATLSDHIFVCNYSIQHPCHQTCYPHL